MSEESIKGFIERDDTAKEMIKHAEGLAKKLEKVTTSQMRNAYGTVKKIEMSGLSETALRQLLLLKPKMSYTQARINNKDAATAYKELATDIGLAIDAISLKDPQTFVRFCNFFEAVVAYHKLHSKS